MLFNRRGFLTLVVFCIFNCLEYAVALKQGDKGVCVVTISVQKMRGVRVPTGRMCGDEPCLVKKIEYYSEPEMRIICCNGWEYDMSSDSCSAICTTGCVRGRCVAPDVCHCDPPMYLDPEIKNSCLEPTCDPPCVNAQCGLNNTCMCHPYHSRFNASHCIYCSSGYQPNHRFECAPVCNDCPGICMAPYLCKCGHGYQMSPDETACNPVCKVLCKNGDCKNEECVCKEGFVKSADNAYVCERMCELPGVAEQR